MKKYLALIISAFLILTMCACSSESAMDTVIDDFTEKLHIGKANDSKQSADESDIAEPDDTDESTISAGEEQSSVDEEPPASSGGSAAAEFDPDFTFSTTDRTGNHYDETVFAGHKLTILNFWEPWCGPCVQEMPELQRLYENYNSKGLQIIGVYSTPDMETDVDAVLNSSGVTFTILQYTDVFDMFQTGYVPTTIFVNGEGKVVGDTYIGSRSYSDWEALILEYMS